jgi:hypothetical protein
MKKTKKDKTLWLKPDEIEVGCLYQTTAQQYRAVLAKNHEFLIYAPSSEGMPVLSAIEPLPFENAPFKKCQISTFAQKEYQIFEFNGARSKYHVLSESQLTQAITQCNAKAAIAGL